MHHPQCLLLLLALQAAVCCCSSSSHAHSGPWHVEGCGQHHPLVLQQQAALHRRLQQLRRQHNAAAAAASSAVDYEHTDSISSSSSSSVDGAAAVVSSGSMAAASMSSSSGRSLQADKQENDNNNNNNNQPKTSSANNHKQQQQQAKQKAAAAAKPSSPAAKKVVKPPPAAAAAAAVFDVAAVYHLSGLSVSSMNRLKQQLVPAAIKVLQKHIKVLRRPAGQQRISKRGLDGEPQQQQQQQQQQVSSCLHSTVNSSLAGVVSSRPSLLLYVSSDASSCIAGMIAAAAACDVDPLTQRPTVGSINICPGALTALPAAAAAAAAGRQHGSTAAAAAMGKVVEALVHEIVHVMGFGAIHYADWRGPDGNTYGQNNVIKQVGGRPYLATPKVTAVARHYFGCRSLPGAPLENEGPAVSAASHFEYRLLQRELMSPSRPVDSSRARLTAFTLAALEDTGWYVADYSQAAPLDWGRNAGCGFVTQSCWDYMALNPNQPYYCGHGTANQTRCTPEASGWGVCRSSAFSDGCLLVGQHSSTAVRSTLQYDDGQAACYSPPELAAAAARRGHDSAQLLPLLGGSYTAQRSAICYNLVQPEPQFGGSDVVWVDGHGQLPEDIGKTPAQIAAGGGRSDGVGSNAVGALQQQQQRPLDSARVAVHPAPAACVAAASGRGSSSVGRGLLSGVADMLLLGRGSRRHLATAPTVLSTDSVQRQLALHSSNLAASSNAACTTSPVLCFKSSCDKHGRLCITATYPGRTPVMFACPSRSVINLSQQMPGHYLLGFLQCPSNVLVCESMGCGQCSQSGGFCSRGKCYCHMEWFGKACSQTLVPRLK